MECIKLYSHTWNTSIQKTCYLIYLKPFNMGLMELVSGGLGF